MKHGITTAAMFWLLSFTWNGWSLTIPSHQYKQHRLHVQHNIVETSPSSSLYLQDWNLDPYDLDNDTLLSLAVDMISTSVDVSQFGVKEEQIRSFLKEVQSRYNRPAFHTFHHAWGTMFLTYQILQRGEVDSLLSPLATFALLVASVCHDLDHPGNNNGFEVASDSDLAQRYEYEAILERHHIAVTRELLETDTEIHHADYNPASSVAAASSSSSSSSKSKSLLGALSVGDQEMFLGYVEQAILATDMAHHFQLVDTLQQQQTQLPPQQHPSQHLQHQIPAKVPSSTPTNPSSHMNTLIGVILHAADVGAQTQRLEVALRWGDRVVKEFQDQAMLERELGLPPTPYMQGLEEEHARMELQAGFVGGIVVPLWRALAQSLPALTFAADQADANHHHYTTRAAELRLSQKSFMSMEGDDSSSSSNNNDEMGEEEAVDFIDLEYRQLCRPRPAASRGTRSISETKFKR